MDDKVKYKVIIEKLDSGMKFGLFDKGMKCYFEDGTHIGYSDLWKAMRIAKDLPPDTSQTIQELFPDSFVGSHKYKHTQFNWKKTSKYVFGFW